MYLSRIKGKASILAMETKHLTFVFPIALLIYIFNSRTSNKVGVEIKIHNGLVEGTTGVSRDGREFYEFLGIPYARPPVGELRFEVSQSQTSNRHFEFNLILIIYQIFIVILATRTTVGLGRNPACQ